jgi:DNA-binding LacI/PurR family transcriptional regulator
MVESEAQDRRPITLQEIASRCGVHKSTVQRALAGTSRISGRVAKRIRAVAGEMGYDPASQQAARRMAARRHGREAINQVIALFFPQNFYRINYFMRIFGGILDVLSPARFDLLTTYTDFDPAISLPQSVARGDVDAALVLAHSSIIRRTFTRLRAVPSFGSRPLATLINPLAGYSCVTADFHRGAYQAVTHLLDLGHRDILHFHGLERYQREPHEPQILQRIAAYHEAYAERGIDSAKHLHMEGVDHSVPPPQRLREGLARALKKCPKITAILAPNDPDAVQLVEDLKDHGLRVPRDISLIGFDDTNVLLDARRENTLTTVQLPLDDIGREGARLLMRQVQGEAVRNQEIVLDAKLIVRGSTAPPRSVSSERVSSLEPDGRSASRRTPRSQRARR